MASFAPNASGFIKLDAQIKMQGKKTTKIRPVVIQLPSSLEAIRDEILNQHNTGTVPKGIKLSKYVLLSGTGAPLDDGFIPYLNSGERVILFEKKKEKRSSVIDSWMIVLSVYACKRIVGNKLRVSSKA